MSKILIATIYNAYSIIATANRFSVDKVILLFDKKPDDTMKKSIQLIEASLGSVLTIDKVATEIYDIVGIARQLVGTIDKIDQHNEIYIDITSGRKPKALGLLFAAYARSKRIKRITYVTEDTKQIITLPKMTYTINETQQRSLALIAKHKQISTSKISEILDLTKGIVYRNVRDLLEMDAIEKDGELLKLTDFGEILLL